MIRESISFVTKYWTLPTISKVLPILVVLLCFFLTAFAHRPDSKYIFIENKGQWPSEVLFKTDVPGGYLYITKKGLKYFFYDSEALASLHAAPKNKPGAKKAIQEIKTQTVEVSFKNANQPLLKAENPRPEVYNYFYGNDTSNWVSDSKAYDEIWLREIYKSIDLRLYSIGDALKYEYVVHEGGDPKDIAMQYEGQSNLQLENGRIALKTEINQINEFEPYTFQQINGLRTSVASKYSLRDNVLTFDIENYDHHQDLIIDPEVVFSTYSGSISDNWSHTATFDSKGNLYAGGSVFGPNYPITNGVAQPNLGGATNDPGFVLTTDIVINKYSADGQELLYSTFLGGTHSEVPHSLICNSKDELVIYGTTASPDFPVSSSAFQKNFRGGIPLNGGPITTNIGFVNGTDMFVSVLSENGDRIKGSTLIGGGENDGIHDNRAFLIQNYGDEFRGEVYVDKNDDIYVASTTTSDDFPIRNSNSRLASQYDGIVFQMNENVSQLKWSSYIGGRTYDAAYGIRVNDAGDVYVVGSTLSDDLPSSPNVFKPNLTGEADAFIAKFSNQRLAKLTYLGTESEDLGYLIDLDAEDNVYVFGLSQGAYPVNGPVYQNPGSGQFIHSLNSELTQTNFSTVIGTGNGVGTIDLVPTAFLVNDCRNIYIAGWGGIINVNNEYNPTSTTLGLPITSDAFRDETTGSNYYFAILEAEARSLLYATYFGSEPPPGDEVERGDHLDGGTCRFDKNGIIYHSACVCRSTGTGFVGFPTENAIFPTHNSSNCNMAAFKFDIDVLEANFDILDRSEVNPNQICQGSTVKFDNLSKGGITYQWSIDGEVFSRLAEPDFQFEIAGTFDILLETFNLVTCSRSDSFNRSITVIPFETQVSADSSVCAGSEVVLFAAGGDAYSWSPSSMFENANDANPTILINESTVFTVEISNSECSIEKEITYLVEDSKEDFIVSNSLEACSGDEITLRATGLADYFEWTIDGQILLGDSVSVIPTQTSSYSVQAFYNDGCKPKKEIQILIDQSFQPEFDYQIKYDCGKPFELEFVNNSPAGSDFTWYMGNGDSLKAEVPVNYSYSTHGEYEVDLKATNQIGCELHFLRVVSIPEDDGIIPNAISPNNDGKNDTFVIGLSNVGLKIFNRWGKTIFETDDYKNDWGTDVAIGTYYYEIQIPEGKNCKGWIEVFP
ncbi:DUF7948 domain-containing protein [Jiulongibacter sp. NS-SX5]|uniref:DUF7948 domain-containing protein n=1 Tax=Jiulongibacter sp. NS-SX5 TaxID=3463854 RepID=UPI004058F4A4